MPIPFPERYTAIPHSIIRRLARFSGAELHVLLAIADQTLGYAEGAGRRESAWISHQRFKALTGLSNDAISRALACLVRRGEVVAETSSGQALVTPKARKAHRGRIFYRLADPKRNPQPPGTGPLPSGTSPPPNAQKAPTETESVTRAMQPAPHEPQSQAAIPQSGMEPSPRRLTEAPPFPKSGMEPSSSHPPIPVFGIEESPMEIPITGMDALHGASTAPAEEPTIPLSRFQKAEWIKEREKENTKDRQSFAIPPTAESGNETKKVAENEHAVERGNISPRSRAPFSWEENALARWGEAAAQETDAQEDTLQHQEQLEADLETFLRAFQNAYRAHRPGERVPPMTRDDLELLGRRLIGGETHSGGHISGRSVRQLEALLPEFFRFDAAYVGRRNWSLDAFLDCLYILEARHTPARRTGSWHRASPGLSHLRKDKREEE